MKRANDLRRRRQPLVRVGPTCLSGDELSADPFEFLATRVAKLELTAIQVSCELDGQAEAGFNVGGERAQLGRRVSVPAPAWAVSPHPVLCLPHRKMSRDHHLEAVFLRRLALEGDQG